MRLTSSPLRFAALLILFLISTIGIAAAPGIQRGADSGRYLGGADRLLAGQPLIEKQASYSGTVAYVALMQASGAGLNGIVIGQVLIALAAMLALTHLAAGRGGAWAGFAAAALFACDVQIARWHFFILTDSLYISCVILTAWAVVWAGDRHGWRTLLACAIALITALIRPNGWIVLPVVAITWISQIPLEPPPASGHLPLARGRTAGAKRRQVGVIRWLLIAGVILLSVIAAAGLSGFRSGIEAESPGKMLREGRVIWANDSYQQAMPADPVGDESWIGSLGYALRHPLESLRLALVRVAVNLLDVRPYQSDAQNFSRLAWLIPVYLLAILGAVRAWADPATRLLSAIIGTHLLTVGLTFADSDGRFVRYIIPLFYVLAAWGLIPSPSRLRIPDRVLAISTAGLACLPLLAGLLAGQPDRSVYFSAPPAEAVPVGANFSGVELVAFSPPATNHILAEYISLRLHWRLITPVEHDLRVSVQFLDPQGERIAWSDATLGQFAFPRILTSGWLAGWTLSESVLAHIPADAPPVLDVYATLYDPQSNGRLMILDTAGAPTGQDRIRIARHGLITEAGIPALAGEVTLADDRIGERLHVTGFQLPGSIRVGDDLRVDVRIEATQPIYEDYTVFFHLLDPAGARVAQSDSPTLAGDWTTAALIPHQPLGFERIIDLPGDLAPGKYRILMGFYHPITLERLPVIDAAGVRLPDGLIEVGWVEIK
jgi:hypothetical protein